MHACEIWRRRGQSWVENWRAPAARFVRVRVLFSATRKLISTQHSWGALLHEHARTRVHKAPPPQREKMRECANDMLLWSRATLRRACVLLRREFNGWLSRLLCAQYNVLCRLRVLRSRIGKTSATASFCQSEFLIRRKSGAIKSIQTR